jgi:hypothetical protein
MPPGVSVPLHSHKAVEVFFILSGNVEVLLEDGAKMSWVEASAGNLIEIPSKAKHAFRNSSQHPVINLLYTASDHGRYFQEIGRPATSEESVSPPAPDEIQRLLETARRYGYWFATPEENASVGITIQPGHRRCSEEQDSTACKRKPPWLCSRRAASSERRSPGFW